MTTALRIMAGIFGALAGLLFHFNYPISGLFFSALTIASFLISLFTHRKEELSKQKAVNTMNNMSQPIYRTEIKNGIKTTYKFDPITETETVVNTSLEV